MKKLLLVMALAVVLTLAFASSAFAYTPTPVYIAWDGTGLNSNGPHADYQTTTTKCAVCHSVHIAPTAGYVGNTNGVSWTATAPTELLLRGSAANSCKFCHIDTSVGGVQLYGGSGGVYGSWGGPGHKGSGNSACINCHAVHGANTYKGANTSKILRVSVNDHGAAGVAQPETLGGAGATAGIFTDQAAAINAPARKYEQQVVFCSQCHGVFSRSADTTLTSGFKGHSFVSAPSAAFSATTGGPATKYNSAGAVVAGASATLNSGVTISSASNIMVASAASSSCRACHTAGGVDQSGVSYNSFPHYTRGMPYFLGAGAVSLGGAASTIDNFGVTNGTTMLPEFDGNCISCHSTVGTTF